MGNMLHKIAQAAADCTCGKHNRISLDTVVVERGALVQAVPYLLERSCKHVTVVADATTFEAAGQWLVDGLRNAELDFSQIILSGNHQGDVVADEPSIIQVMLETPNTTDVIIAVGSGTIHDIVRFTGIR